MTLAEYAAFGLHNQRA